MRCVSIVPAFVLVGPSGGAMQNRAPLGVALKLVLPAMILTLVSAALAAPLPAQETSPDPVPQHDTLMLPSRALGETRRINVHTPPAYAESDTARFPVLYMPDGGLDEDFPHVVNTVDSLIALGAIRAVIVVGVPNTERRRDLTGPTRVKSDSAIAPHIGGSAAFRRFWHDELAPVIDARYRTTSERGIVGESLAGLFIVESFLREPTIFDHYIAFDPSLWWNHGALVDSATALLANGKGSSPQHRTLYIAASRDDIGNQTTRLASTLRTSAPHGLEWKFEPRPDLTHGTIFRALLPAALVSALK
jgi:predicted alpha/beta superfamily hydrolase